MSILTCRDSVSNLHKLFSDDGYRYDTAWYQPQATWEYDLFRYFLKQIFLNHLLLFGSGLCMLDPIITRGNTKDFVEGSIE